MLTQFGTLQSKSHIALPSDPGSSAATCSCFCLHICLPLSHAPRLCTHVDVGQELLHHHAPAKGRYPGGVTPKMPICLT